MNREIGTEQEVIREDADMLSPARPAHTQRQNRPLMRLVGLGIMLLGSAIVILTLLLLILPLFRVGKIEVVGNSHYTAEEIIKSAGLEEGVEVLSIDAKKTSDALLDASPYLQSCKISVFPFSVKIEVKEKSRVMYTEYGGKYVSFELLSEPALLVLEVADESDTMDSFIAASLPEISSARVNGRISFKQQTINIAYMKSVIEVLEEYDLYSKVKSIDFSSRTNLFFEIDSGCRIKLGSASELDDKIVEALNQLNNNHNVIEVDVSDLTKPTVKTY